MSPKRWRIATATDELQEGLFGQIVLYTFELLPHLAEQGVLPAWDVRSRFYGVAPDFRVIPGVFDLAYEPPVAVDRELGFTALRVAQARVLGGDFDGLHRLWTRYFAIPTRITDVADQHPVGPRTLGLHFRGTDKNTAAWDTNPITQDDFLTLAEDFVARHPEIENIFIATDEFSFVEHARRRLTSRPIVNLGEVQFHKAAENVPHKADRAVLDCVLLSRCGDVLKCSSALSGFAKVLNPQLRAWRVSASKMFADIPYFPEAYVPRLQTDDARCRAILERQFRDDWQDDAETFRRFGTPFVSTRRSLRAQLVNTYWHYRRHFGPKLKRSLGLAKA